MGQLHAFRKPCCSRAIGYDDHVIGGVIRQVERVCLPVISHQIGEAPETLSLPQHEAFLKQNGTKRASYNVLASFILSEIPHFTQRKRE